MYTSHPHNVIVLSSRFQYSDRRLFFTRARLFFDRIELSGWNLGKRHEHVVAIDEIARVEWEAAASVLVLHLNAGEPMRLHLNRPDSWRHSLEQRLRWRATTAPWQLSSATLSAARSELPLHEVVTFTTCMG